MARKIKITRDEFYELNVSQGKSLTEIAKIIGCHPDCLSKHVRHTLGLPVKQKSRKQYIPVELHASIISDYFEIGSIREIMKKYNISRPKITNLLKDNNIDVMAVKSDNQSKRLSGVCKRTTESYAIELQGRNIELIGEYTGISHKHPHKCLVCGNIWEAVIGNILSRNSGCPVCAIEINAKKRALDPAEYEKRLAKLCPNLIALEDYVSYFTKIKHKCLTCGGISVKMPVTKATMSGCKTCNPPGGVLGIKTVIDGIEFDSMLEATMYTELINHVQKSDIRHKRWYPDNRYCSDFYIQSMDLWIEVSNFNTVEYLEKIYKKRLLVTNFAFFTTPTQMSDYFKEKNNNVK